MGLEAKTGHIEDGDFAADSGVACTLAAPGRGAVPTPVQPIRKPILPPRALVASLKSRGITFMLCDEDEAGTYLRDANNYLRCASYRVMFDRKPPANGGGGQGPYANLDFGHLRELSRIDRQLREAFLQTCIDVEHFAKMSVLDRALGEGEDGYAIVANYVASINHKERGRLIGGLAARAREGKTHDEYTGDLIAHHLGNLPLWVFLEVVELGSFVDFYRFCAARWEDAAMAQEHYVLKSVKALRNACAHNSCIVNGFTARSKRPMTAPHAPVTESLNASGMPNGKTRRSKLGNLRIMQMASALWALKRFCASERTMKRNAAKFDALRTCVEANRTLFAKTNSIMPYFDFLWKLVDIWVPTQA